MLLSIHGVAEFCALWIAGARSIRFFHGELVRVPAQDGFDGKPGPFVQDDSLYVRLPVWAK